MKKIVKKETEKAMDDEPKRENPRRKFIAATYSKYRCTVYIIERPTPR